LIIWYKKNETTTKKIIKKKKKYYPGKSWVWPGTWDRDNSIDVWYHQKSIVKKDMKKKNIVEHWYQKRK